MCVGRLSGAHHTETEHYVYSCVACMTTGHTSSGGSRGRSQGAMDTPFQSIAMCMHGFILVQLLASY